MRTATVVRTDPRYNASVQTRVNTGEIDYDALMFQLEKRYSHSHQFRVSYTWSKSRGNTGGGFVPLSNFQFLDDMNLDMNEGPTDVDRPHNFVFSGAAVIPKTGGVTFSTVVRYLSGTTFTVHDSTTDPDRNGILVDPLPAGTYSGNGSDSITVESEGGRNGATRAQLLPGRRPPRLSPQARRRAHGGAVRRSLQRDQPGQLRQPDRRSLLDELPEAHRASPGRNSPDVPVRRSLRVLGRLIVDVNGLGAGFARRRGRLLSFRIW